MPHENYRINLHNIHAYIYIYNILRVYANVCVCVRAYNILLYILYARDGSIFPVIHCFCGFMIRSYTAIIYRYVIRNRK